MDKSIYECISNAQHDRSKDNDMEALVRRFQPLIKKHAHLLRYDDAANDVTLAFIEAIYKISLSGFVQDGKDYAIISYIERSVRNAYINFSVKSSSYNAMNTQFDEKIASAVISYNSTDEFEMRGRIIRTHSKTKIRDNT